MPGPVVSNILNTAVKRGSPNKVIVNSLIATFQKEVKPEKLYQTLKKITEDLNAVYENLFDGPLPAVDGFKLTRLNAAVLEGVIPEEYRLAYKDEVNDFTRGQEIIQDNDEEPFWIFGFGDETVDPVIDPASFFRIGALTDEEFYISQNMFWDGTGWDRDSAVGAIRLDFIDGELLAWQYDSALTDFRKIFHLVGKELLVENFDQDDDIAVYEVDDDDIVRFANTPALDGGAEGWPAIPNVDETELPTASASTPTTNGIIGIDETNHRFIFYTDDGRYYVQGISF